MEPRSSSLLQEVASDFEFVENAPEESAVLEVPFEIGFKREGPKELSFPPAQALTIGIASGRVDERVQTLGGRRIIAEVDAVAEAVAAAVKGARARTAPALG